MNKLKELWSKAVFRWFVYGGIPLLFWTLAGVGAFSWEGGDDSAFEFDNANPVSEGMGIFIWFLILIIPSVWVWRKPIWKLVKQAIGFLNRKAEED